MNVNYLLHSLKHYVFHKLNDSGLHSLHSPFMYQFYQLCVLKRAVDFNESPIINCRNSLLNNHQIIEFHDLGAGSRTHLNPLSKSISKIAKNSLSSRKKARFLANFSAFVEAKNIIELGTSLGISTQYLSFANPLSKIQTIEGISAIAQIAQNCFNQNHCANVQLIVAEFKDAFHQIRNDAPDLVFIDGNHSYQPTIEYFEFLRNKMEAQGFIIFDDLYWSPEMTKAWNDIYQSQEVTLSIDLFDFGIISFNKRFSKQHFQLRF